MWLKCSIFTAVLGIKSHESVEKNENLRISRENLSMYQPDSAGRGQSSHTIEPLILRSANMDICFLSQEQLKLSFLRLANQSLHACCDRILQILTSSHFEKESLSTCPHDVPIIIQPSLPAVTGQGLAPRGALLKSPTFLSWLSAHNDGYTEDYIT